MDLPDLANLPQNFGPRIRLPKVRLPVRRKFGESEEYSKIDQALKKIVEDAYRYARKIVPAKQQAKRLPIPDYSKYTSFSPLSGDIINKLAEKLLTERAPSKKKPVKIKSNLLPKWEGGIYHDANQPSSSSIHHHTDVAGCSAVGVVSDELCLFCSDDQELEETTPAEQTFSFSNGLRYGSVDGSVVTTIPTAFRISPSQESPANALTMVESMVTDLGVENTMADMEQITVYPPLAFTKKIKKEHFYLPACIFTDLGLPVPEQIDEASKKKKKPTKSKYKKKAASKSKGNILPTPPTTASESSDHRIEEDHMTEIEEMEPIPALIPSSSPVPDVIVREIVSKVEMVEEDDMEPFVITPDHIFPPEELADELALCYNGIPASVISDFHRDFMTQLSDLKNALLERRESELAAASVTFLDEQEQGEEEEEEEEEEQYETDIEPAPITPRKNRQLYNRSSSTDTTERDLEEFAEFFPDYPQRFSSCNRSPPEVVSRPSEEIIDVVGVEGPSTSFTCNQEGVLNNTHPSWYSDSEPSSRFCSREPSSEKNINVEVTTPTKVSQEWPSPERPAGLIAQDPFSSDDEVYGQYPYKKARFSPVSDTSLMPSPIASQQ